MGLRFLESSLPKGFNKRATPTIQKFASPQNFAVSEAHKQKTPMDFNMLSGEQKTVLTLSKFANPHQLHYRSFLT